MLRRHVEALSPHISVFLLLLGVSVLADNFDRIAEYLHILTGEAVLLAWPVVCALEEPGSSGLSVVICRVEAPAAVNCQTIREPVALRRQAQAVTACSSVAAINAAWP